MTGEFNHRISSLLFAGLCIAVFLTTSLPIVNGQGYYNPYAFNNTQTTIDRIDAAKAYQNLYGEYYNPYSYNNDPQSALDLADLARANQMQYNYDSSDWNYWANLWLNAPY
jgi:hypothetical protein